MLLHVFSSMPVGRKNKNLPFFLLFFSSAGVTKVTWESGWLLMMESLQPPLVIHYHTHIQRMSFIIGVLYLFFVVVAVFVFVFVLVYLCCSISFEFPTTSNTPTGWFFAFQFGFFFQFLFLFEFCLHSTISQQRSETKVSWGKENNPPTLLCGGVVVLEAFLFTFINMALAPY